MIKNFGVIEGQRQTDYIAGTLPYEVRNPSGDWTEFLPLGEWQTNHIVDTMACVSFSALNSMETQYRFLTGQHRNFSDRFTATMSGTTQQGNYLWKVGDSIRHDGLVDDSDWQVPANYTWDSYYSPVPVEVVDKGHKFLEEWDIKYEFIDITKESLMYHLKQSPIQIVIPGHAILNFYTNAQVIKYFDSYEPFIKEAGLISSALKYVLTSKKKVMTEEEVKKQYALAFYRLPDAGELSYWVGKPLIDFLNTAIKDRANFLNQQ